MPGAPRPPIAPALGAGGGGATAGALIVSARDGVLALGAAAGAIAGAVACGVGLGLAAGVGVVMAGSGAGAGVVSTGTGAIMACAVSTACVVSAAAPVSGILPHPRIHQARSNTTAIPITQGNQLRSGAFEPGADDVLMIILR